MFHRLYGMQNPSPLESERGQAVSCLKRQLSGRDGDSDDHGIRMRPPKRQVQFHDKEVTRSRQLMDEDEDVDEGYYSLRSRTPISKAYSVVPIFGEYRTRTIRDLDEPRDAAMSHRRHRRPTPSSPPEHPLATEVNSTSPDPLDLVATRYLLTVKDPM